MSTKGSSNMKILGALALVLAIPAGAAEAHVTADPGEAPAGAYRAVRFRVGHACRDTVATTAVRIELPAGLKAARPQPKPGWSLAIDHDAAGAVTAITWKGRLPADEFDEFAVYIRAPEAPGVLYFPTVQTCGRESEQWVEVPRPGDDARLKHPAPSLRLTPAASENGHHH